MDLKKELGGVADAVTKIMDEALKGDQHKIDANKNNKIDAHDFKLLRSKKKVEEAAAKPDFIDLDKDGDKKEPMKKAASDKKMKEEVKQIDELSNKTLYSYLRKTGGVKSSTEVHPRNTSNVPHDLQYQAQDSAKSRINARKGHGSVAPKGYAKEEVQMEDAVGLAKPKTGLTAAAKTLAPQTRVAEASKPPFDKPYTTIKGTVTDKSGAKHTPMSRARDIARMAMKKQIEKMKQPVKESLDESRRMEIVREAMKVAKKKKETMAADDKYQSDPVLSSQINKT